MPAMSRRKIARGAPVARAALALLLALSQSAPARAQFGPQGPPAVGVQEASRQPVTESTEFVGRVEALQRVDVVARVTGYLQEVVFREGQEVRRGDVLYRIERQTFEADVARAAANVASADAELQNARVALSRAQELTRTGAGTRVSLDNATAQERSGNAQLLAARAAARAAEINLAYTEVTSPIDGKIGRTNVTVGNVVGPQGGTLATIVGQDPMRVAFPVSQRQALELRDRYASRGGSDAVRVRFRTADGRTYPDTGQIDFIDNQINRNTDSILVRARVPNPPRDGGDRSLIDGQFVTVAVEGVEPVLAITIPRSAVLQDQQGSYAFIVDAENKAQRRNLRLGRNTPQVAVVEEGLNPGDRVIVEGIQRVRPGQEVNAAPVQPAPGSAPAGRAVPRRGTPPRATRRRAPRPAAPTRARSRAVRAVPAPPRPARPPPRPPAPPGQVSPGPRRPPPTSPAPPAKAAP